MHPRCVFTQNTKLSQCLSPASCINENQQIAWGQPDKTLGGNLRWTSIPSRGSRNTPSRFILQEPELRADSDKSSWLTQLRLGQTLLFIRRIFGILIGNNILESTLENSLFAKIGCVETFLTKTPLLLSPKMYHKINVPLYGLIG